MAMNDNPAKSKPLPTNVSTAKGVPASDRIQKRRKLVAAKIGLTPTKKPKHTTSAVVPGEWKHVKLICHRLGRNFCQDDMYTIPGPVKLSMPFLMSDEKESIQQEPRYKLSLQTHEARLRDSGIFFDKFSVTNQKLRYAHTFVSVHGV